jgi:hypothetical protein
LKVIFVFLVLDTFMDKIAISVRLEWTKGAKCLLMVPDTQFFSFSLYPFRRC